jgi:Na+-transporting methylmalonyl-CoA/oxaloacetate decarboxylase gamma subunit
VASALRRCRNEAAEEGSAVVEFVFLGLMLLVPVVYFVLTVSALQGASFAATGAADHAAKTFAQAGDEAAARGAAQAAVELAMSDFGLAEHSTRLEIGCDRTPCLQAGGAVKAIVRVDVPLPFSPVTSGLGLTVGRIEASATQIVGRFR